MLTLCIVYAHELCCTSFRQATCVQGHPEEVYAAEFLQGGSGSRMLTASTWLPYIWDLEICQQVAEGPPIQGPELIDNGAFPDSAQPIDAKKS